MKGTLTSIGMLTEEEKVQISEDSSLASIAARSLAEIKSDFDVDLLLGLTEADVLARRKRWGKNQVIPEDQVTVFQLLYRQFASSVVILLLVAALISFATGDHLQAIGILIAVIINAVVGFITEMRAKVSLEALEQIASPTTRVVRGGSDHTVLASDLVPGDLVKLDAGSRVPADLRIIEDASLCLDESVLTGESIAKTKSSTILADHEGDEADSFSTIAYHGTHVLDGRGMGVVVKTGSDTSLGELQQSLIESHTVPTPMEVRLEELGRQLTWLTVVMCVVIVAIGLLYKHDFWSMLEAAIALAVAAIPEGLPVVATLALAMGTQKMVKLGSLIRQLAAVETLGCTTIICSDKTGTLTQNKLMVTDICLGVDELKVSGEGFKPEGKIEKTSSGQENYRCEDDAVLQELVLAGLLCNDSTLTEEPEEGWVILGDPTEGALLVLAAKAGLGSELIEVSQAHKRLKEFPFDLERKRMVTINALGFSSGSEAENEVRAFIKGSPEVVVESCSHLRTGSGLDDLDEEWRARYLALNDQYAGRGLRVLALAEKNLSKDEVENCSFSDFEQGLTLLGLVAMQDRARKGVYEAIQKCRSAGIKVMMLTGDQVRTAVNIAKDLKLAETIAERSVVSGAQLGKLTSSEEKERLKEAVVLARVNPSLKLNIVKTLQEMGNVVAMTGDGVYDAPALKQANIGVAMGRSGTDLAREASNMVITDDNFATIVSAIKEGRMIYENIRRAICYLTATVASVTIAAAIIYDGTLAMEPFTITLAQFDHAYLSWSGDSHAGGGAGHMQRSPRDAKESIIGRFEAEQIVVRHCCLSWRSGRDYNDPFSRYGSDLYVTTVAFSTSSPSDCCSVPAWALSQSDHKAPKPPVNKFMYLMMFVSYLSVITAVYLPGLASILKTQPLELPELFTVFFFSGGSVVLTLFYEYLRPLLAGKKKSV
ncbi:MAG: HAD-IC family P-type ATPase [Cyanobacteriota/Melainabacteria group bacterium]